MTNITSSHKSKMLKRFEWFKKGFLLLILIFYWVIFNYCDPFGVKSGTEDGSTRVFYALGMPGYGIGNPETHKHVAVVTVNDQTFSDAGSVFASQRWPLSYTSQNSILMKILQANPAALFVDVRFIYQRSNQQGDLSLDQAFRPVIDLAKQKHIPILFARGDGGIEEEKASTDETKKHDKQNDKEDERNGFQQPDLPGVLKSVEVFSNGDSEEAHYPLIKEAKDDPDHPVFLNPALKIYDELCRERWQPSSIVHSHPEDPDAYLCKGYSIKDYKAPLIVKWGFVRDPYQRFVIKVAEDQQALDQALVSHVWSRVFVDFKRGLVAVSDKFSFLVSTSDKGAGKNYYPLTIPVQSLFCNVDEDELCATMPYDYGRDKACKGLEKRPSFDLQTKEGNGSACEDSGHKLVNDYLKDRVVFYGTDLRDEHDDEDVPFIGRIPGVVVHAMAFDNLMTYRHSYYHVYGRAIGVLPVLKLFNLGVWLILALYMVFVKTKPPKADGSDEGKQSSSDQGRSGYPKACHLLGGRQIGWLDGVRASFVSFWWGGMAVSGRRWDRPRKAIRILFPLTLGFFAAIAGHILGDPTEGAMFLGLIVGGYFLLFFNVEKGYCLNIMLIGMIECLIFQLNVSWLRWDNTDWMSLAVLWTATQRGEFVENMTPVVTKGCQKAKGLFFAIHGEKLFDWFNRGRHLISGRGGSTGR